MSQQWNHPSQQPEPHHHGKPKKNRTGWKVFLGVFGGILLAVFLVVGGCTAIVAGDEPGKPEKPTSEPKKDSGPSGREGTGKDATEDPDTLSDNDAHPPRDDVKMSTLVTQEEFGFKNSSVTVTVKNNSGESSDYFIELELLNAAGDRVEDYPVSTDNLKPGKTFSQKIEFTEAGKKVSVKSVDRISSAYN
jgi:hypothetical protein